MMHKIVKSWIILTIPLLLANATSLASQPLQLSFSQAWEIARSDNPQIRQAMMNVDKAKAQIGEAYSAAMPSISASGYYQRNFIIPKMVTEMPPEFGGGTVTFQFEQDNFVSGQIELAQPVYAAGKVGLALKIAKLYNQVSREQLSQTEAEVKLLITRLYFGAVVAAEWERVSRETYDQMQDHLEKVGKMHQEGLVSEYDLIRSQVQVSNFFPQVINAQTTREVAYESLAMVLDLPKDQPLELIDRLDMYPISEVEVEDPFKLALQQRSELRQMDLQEKMLGKLLTIEKHGVWWPNVFLVGGYTTYAQEPEFDVENYYWVENLYGGISLSIPIFDGFKAKYRAQQVKADMKMLNLQRDQLVRGINLEIIRAQSKLREALKNVQAQEEGVDMAHKGLEIAEVRYENGLATHLEVMDAQIALNQARTNELAARYDAITAKAELEKAVGLN